jgi:hypothetical protein
MYDIQKFAATLTVAEHFRDKIPYRSFVLLWTVEDYEEIKDILIEAEIIREFTQRDPFGTVNEVYWGWND